MGTRGLTIIKIDGEVKVAQYGQWDHYPSGQGIVILRILRKIVEDGELDQFKEKVRSMNWLTKAQSEALDKTKDWDEKHPYLSRDCGGKILQAIHYGTLEIGSEYSGKKTVPIEIIGLVDSSNFAEDGLFCEGIFEIDLDTGTYTACGQSFQIESLPSEDEFLNQFKKEED